MWFAYRLIYALAKQNPLTSVDASGMAPTVADCVRASKIVWDAMENQFPTHHTAGSRYVFQRKKCVPIVKCECCGDNLKGYVGETIVPWFSPPTITICTDHFPIGRDGFGDLLDALVHEHVHALDDCKQIDADDCEGIACSEIRAYSHSNECEVGHRKFIEMMIGGAKTYRECVIKATEKELADNDCPKELAAKFFDKCEAPRGKPVPKWPL